MRTEYRKKREQIFMSRTNFIEIDLLRSGKPFHVAPQYDEYHYRIMVSRGWQRPRAALYAFNVTQPIPEIPIPLRKGEDEPRIAIGDLLEQIYVENRYDSAEKSPTSILVRSRTFGRF
ncbi:MAG: DUF4058 family protein [Chloroflexota bacterium]